ncbi:MAG: hypothetical protein ABL876_03270 [Chitinophagaceae bacterium]
MCNKAGEEQYRINLRLLTILRSGAANWQGCSSSPILLRNIVSA